MDLLPDELILRIFSSLTKDAEQLLRLEFVCRRFYRITQEPSLWFQVFRHNYPIWSSQVECITRSQPLIDWKDFVVHIAKQNRQAQSFQLEFVPDETSIDQAKAAAAQQHKVPQKRKLAEEQDNENSRIRPSTSSPHKSVCTASSSSSGHNSNMNEDYSSSEHHHNNKRSPSPYSSTSMPIIHSSSNSSSSPYSRHPRQVLPNYSTSMDIRFDMSSPPPPPPLSSLYTTTPTDSPYIATTPVPSSSNSSSSSSSSNHNNNSNNNNRRNMQHTPVDPSSHTLLERLERQVENQALLNAFDPHPALANIREEPVFERPGQQFFPPPFRIQDPLVVDIDRVTKKGVVATGKHRKEAYDGHQQHAQRSEHKILFWEYPSWRLMREFDLSFAPANTSCQITGIQTIRMFTPPSSNQQENGDHKKRTTQKVRLFSLVVGQPILAQADDAEGDDRLDLWRTVLVYRLFDNGATQCVAHLNMDGQLLGRDVFFFSEASWCQSNDGEENPDEKDQQRESVQEWMKIVAPEYANFDTTFTAFMLAIGPDYPHVSGCGRLLRFDIRGDRTILDPTTEPVLWDSNHRRFVPLFPAKSSSRMRLNHRLGFIRGTAGIMPRSYGPPAAVIARIPMGRQISCMIHFRHPPQLNHLICTGSYITDELTVYDWRFGLKVGVLPWKTQEERLEQEQRQQQQQQQQQEEADMATQVVAARTPPPAQPPPPPPPDPPIIQQEQNIPPAVDQNIEQHEQPNDFRMDVFLDNLDLQHDDNEDDGDDGEDRSIVQPWGLEATTVLPPYWGNEQRFYDKEDYARRGFRLIAVGDNRSDRLEIKVWDISYLLRVDWNPLSDIDHDMMDIATTTTPSSLSTAAVAAQEEDHTNRFFWWKRGTPRLKRLARQMLNEHEHDDLSFIFDPFNIPQTTTNASSEPIVELPYSPPKDQKSMILVHRFEREDAENNMDPPMPVKYTAYNVLRTSLFLLTEEGRITVMDIETGKMIGTVDNVATVPDIIGPQRQIRGIDVNVVGGNEIVVTSRQGLLRGTMVNPDQ